MLKLVKICGLTQIKIHDLHTSVDTFLTDMTPVALAWEQHCQPHPAYHMIYRSAVAILSRIVQITQPISDVPYQYRSDTITAKY